MAMYTDWLSTGTGLALLQEESRQVAGALENIFGDQLLQIGRWGDPGVFRRFARTRRTAVVGPALAPGVDLVSAPDSLAIGGDCIDAVLLPHVLETADDPHGILREVDRILRPDGHLVVLGFNPLGWWGLRHYLSRRSFPGGVQRMISEHRLRDWLSLLNYGVHRTDFYYFVPPVYRATPAAGPAGESGLAAEAAAVRPRMGSLAGLGRWPVLASCYIVVARKEVFTLTPIRPAFRRPARLVGGLVNPTTRNAA